MTEVHVSIGRLAGALAAVAFALAGDAWQGHAQGQDSINRSARAIPALGLPPLPESYRDSDLAKITLGKKLFFDRRLSFNGTLSCGMCHLEGDAFASTQSRTAIGMEGATLRRNAPGLLNVVYQEFLFHDGRERSLLHQAWMPMIAPDEMANPSFGHVLDRIASLGDYDGLFAAAYPDEGATFATVGDAIANYEATLVSGNSRFDRWRYGNEGRALSSDEIAGFYLFTGNAGCANCHVIGEQDALFTDHGFHDTGVGYRASMEAEAGLAEAANSARVPLPGEIRRNDTGRFEVTQDPRDRWRFKTLGLRNVSLTSPYMHDGSIATLEEVLAYYNKGGIAHEGLDRRIRPLDLSAVEISQLAAFLRSLDGD
jgi:cytochrome c peroxidase